jgi:hypothetical protein
MKKKLTKFSMALIATTLLFTSAFGIEPPAQTWVQAIQVDQAIGVLIKTNCEKKLVMCSGDAIAFVVNGPQNTVKFTDAKGNYVEVTMAGEGNLSATFQIKKNGIPLASAQEYIEMGLPALLSTNGWIQDELMMEYPITVLPADIDTWLYMPAVDSGTTYRFDFVYVKSDSVGCEDYTVPTHIKPYVEVLVHPMPRVIYSGTATDHTLSMCEGDTFDFKAKEKEIELIARNTGKSFKFNFIGDAGIDSLLNGYSLLKIYYSVTQNGTAMTGSLIPTEFTSPIAIAPASAVQLPPPYTLPPGLPIDITLPLPTPDAGLYRLSIDSITSYGCMYRTQPADSAFVELMVYPALSVTTNATDHDLKLCAGDTLTFVADNRVLTMKDSKGTNIDFTFTGVDPSFAIIMDYTITQDSTRCDSARLTTNTLGTTPKLPDLILVPTLPAPYSSPLNPNVDPPLPTGSPTLPRTVKVVISETPGKYRFTIDSLTTTSGCVQKKFTDGYANLLVRPLPTIAFPNDPVCQNGNLQVTLTGACDSPPPTSFTVDYKYTKAPNDDTTVPANLITPPGGGGLSNIFNSFSSESVDANGVKTCVQGVTTGESGRFTFYLKSITDGNCTRTNPTPLW